MHFAEYDSPIGKLLLCSDGEALTGLWIGREAEVPLSEDDVLRRAVEWLDGYFRGEDGTVDFPLAPQGTAFQKRVWDLLLGIPYGQVTTYGDLAKQLGPKMSAQAVGQAVGKNPISILIPCHRCVGAKGQLTGYAWGIEKKQWLLRHEARTTERSTEYALCGISSH